MLSQSAVRDNKWIVNNMTNNNNCCNNKKRRIDETNVIDIKESIISNISQLYLSSKLSDITIVVENESIPCHKSILASQSHFFEAMFTTQMIESKQTQIELKETNAYLFRLLLKLTYFGELDLDALTPNIVVKLFGNYLTDSYIYELI